MRDLCLGPSGQRSHPRAYDLLRHDRGRRQPQRPQHHARTAPRPHHPRLGPDQAAQRPSAPTPHR
eukprot:6442077-Heterocapsa_arctica.AAC.1